jgi:hypothetical protein
MWRVTRSDAAESLWVTGYDAKHYISLLGVVVRISIGDSERIFGNAENWFRRSRGCPSCSAVTG